MTIQFSKSTEQGFTYYTATVRNQECVIVTGGCMIGVHLKNASSRAWRGMGKAFRSLEEAREHYKTAEMRGFIDIVIEDTRPANVVKFSKDFS